MNREVTLKISLRKIRRQRKRIKNMKIINKVIDCLFDIAWELRQV